jgi:hypothetical protein
MLILTYNNVINISVYHGVSSIVYACIDAYLFSPVYVYRDVSDDPQHKDQRGLHERPSL